MPPFEDTSLSTYRLFNNSLGDVLSALLQNARRAGAKIVDLELQVDGADMWLSVTDDGAGIADPSVLLALGRSGWGDSVARGEDPAGMGLFSLAGRDVAIRSSCRETGEAWEVDITSQAWEAGTPATVTAAPLACGTQLRFRLDERWRDDIDQAAHYAALYSPLSVRLNGAPLPRRDWLEGAEAIFEEDGVRIGLFNDCRATHMSPCINFHGVIVTSSMPAVAEKDHSWWARIDIVNAPKLRLVLPARKEMVENAALEALRAAVRRAIYRHIRTLGCHRLPFERWSEARDLGIPLPEADRVLMSWIPQRADWNSLPSARSPVRVADHLLLGSFGPALEQCAALAMQRAGAFQGRLACPDKDMEGYSWYEGLRCISSLHFTIEREGEAFRIDGSQSSELDSGPVDRLSLVLTISGVVEEKVTLPAPVVIDYDDVQCCSLDDARILLASGDPMTPAQLVDLLEGACFSSSGDRDADSWESQHERFLLDARAMATRLLLGDDAALMGRLRAILADQI